MEAFPTIFLIVAVVFVVAVVLLVVVPILRTLSNNKKRVIISKSLAENLNNDQEKQADIIRQFNFALSTLPCTLSIKEFRTLFYKSLDNFTSSLGVEAISACFSDYFLLTGSFLMTRMTTTKRNFFFDDQEPYTIDQYYNANILFRINSDSSLTLLSAEIPEDTDHDTLIKEFVLRLKEILT